MKWFMALNDNDYAEGYEIMAMVAVYSAKLNAPNLEPNLIYNGGENIFTNKMRKLGVNVIFHKLSFEHLLDSVPGRDEKWGQIARGTMLRLDLPDLVDSDETVLYTDTDVFVVSNPCKYSYPCDIFAAAPEFNISNYTAINTGSMVINIGNARSSFKMLRDWTVSNLSIIPDFDQGAIRAFYNGRWGRLDPRMNWKPYWGINKEAIIVHYHGPKPCQFSPGSIVLHDSSLKNIYNMNPDAYEYYVRHWYGFKFELDEYLKNVEKND